MWDSDLFLLTGFEVGWVLTARSTGFRDWHLAQQLRSHLGWLHPLLECLGLSLNAASNSSFLVRCTLGGSSDGSSGWVPAIHMGHLDSRLSSWLMTWPCPAVDVARIWGMNQLIGISVSLSICLTDQSVSKNLKTGV